MQRAQRMIPVEHTPLWNLREADIVRALREGEIATYREHCSEARPCTCTHQQLLGSECALHPGASGASYYVDKGHSRHHQQCSRSHSERFEIPHSHAHCVYDLRSGDPLRQCLDQPPFEPPNEKEETGTDSPKWRAPDKLNKTTPEEVVGIIKGLRLTDDEREDFMGYHSRHQTQLEEEMENDQHQTAAKKARRGPGCGSGSSPAETDPEDKYNEFAKWALTMYDGMFAPELGAS